MSRQRCGYMATLVYHTVTFSEHKRGGRGGGYKELDEEELEETKRRRREAEEDDGELYDEFGNLKKKFRAKTQQAEAGQVLPGAGRAGWEVEELGISPVPLSLLLLGDQILLLKE
ncbi:Transcription initiation factor TFIID subunit 15 [Vitis vinifera]|uniref:Transcription initiation factor TFIID subunit 15 n=1 Tax=Vitis vinifera TaxID=29760 RepID=A0A438FI45_VITVI|nr:Transcription initiation factor TFIID subunit 15 [Vitis vinifera]